MKPFTILFLIFLLLQLISCTISQPDYLLSYCSDGVNYTANSTYRRNLNTLLASFSTSNITGFFNDSAGNPPNRVNGVVLCRGDVSPETCRRCVNDSTVKILQTCPNQIEAIGYYDNCMLRYTNRSIFGVVNQGNIPTYYMRNPENVSESESNGFILVMAFLMGKLARSAAAGDSRKKFETGSSVSGFYMIFGLMQCTPDISGPDCEKCLVGDVEEIPAYSVGTIGWRVIKPNCNLRFENYRFYDIMPQQVAPLPPPGEQLPMSPGSPFSPPEGAVASSGVMVLIIGVTTSAATIIIISLGCYYCFKRKIGIWKGRKSKQDENVEAFISKYQSQMPQRYSYTSIKRMTNSFSDKVGQGGFGGVYKGKLPDGRLVAVKLLKESIGDGKEFINEVSSISRTSHVNIVTLLGFCYEKAKRALVYEYMPNGSLDKFVGNNNEGSKVGELEMKTQFEIAIGIARGLEYLHRGCNTRIVHFDIKPHNILLDEDLCPKIADFGLAKLCKGKESIISMFGARGTAGYIAPEVFMRAYGGVSYKSDVYSYGMMMLEMFAGKQTVDTRDTNSDTYFPDFIYKYLERGTICGCDEEMAEDEEETVRRMIKVGLWCIQTNPMERPSMTRVIEMLESPAELLKVPPKPVLFSSSHPTKFLSSSTNEESITDKDKISIVTP